MYDIAIIGAGVIGAAALRELTKYNLKIVMLERENDVSTGTTKANSAIIHAGYDAPYDTLKGKFNAWGNKIFGDICEELSVPFKRTGSLVCAFDEEDLLTLEALKKNGERLDIPGLKIIDQSSLRAIEPNISDDAIAALYAPTAGITEPWELTIAYIENAIDNGAELKLNYEVKSIREAELGFIISDGDTEIRTRFIINAAGVYADKVYSMVCDDPEFSIIPRRGQYYLLDKTAGAHVNTVVFPCPSKLGKGTLVVPTVDGNLLIGPDSENLSVESKEHIETSYERLELVKSMAKALVKDIPFRENITTFAGLRAEPSNGDFIVEESSINGFYNLAGMKSPGLSSAPAIGIHIAKMIAEERLGLSLRDDFNPYRKPRVKLEHMNDIDKQRLIKEKPEYGRIICRCEMISEGEIIDAIHRSCGGRTLNGIKRRVRPGAGRCQGGFCGPRVMEILARELDIPIEEVLHEGKESKILVGKTKAVN